MSAYRLPYSSNYSMAYAALLLLTALVAGVQSACPGDYMPYNGKCYKVHTQSANWIDAWTYCAEMRSTLVSVDTKELNTFLVNYLRDNPMLHGKYYWIGGAALEVKLKYRWIDGTPFNNAAADWYPGEPNNSGGNEDCLEIMSDSFNYKWNDNVCTALGKGFICEAFTV